MFQFAGSGFPFGMTGFLPPGCPIRVSMVLRLPAAPHGFSQLATPFFASGRLGIRRMPFLA